MNVALCVISDRADLYLPQTLDSLRTYLPIGCDHMILVDDRDHRLGLAGAVNEAWSNVPPETDYIWHHEEDFLLTAPVDIAGMASVLEEHRDLAQLVLKRQPWSPTEVHAGGIIEEHPADYTDRETLGYPWVEHRRIFSLNPCLIPRRVFEQGWPAGNEAEQTIRFMGKRFGFWGKREDPPHCFHVGARRSVGWRL